MSEKLEIPESWSEVTIDVLLEPLSDGRVLHHGWSPQCEAEPSTSDDEWGVLKTTAVQDGLYLEEHNKRLPASLTPRQHLEVKTGDILITCAGPRNRCGVPCLVRHTRPKLILSGKMYRFRVHEAVMDAAFLEGYLRAKDTQTAIDGMKTGISDSGLNLTHGRFFRLKVPVAPLHEQKRIVAKIEELLSDLDAGVASLERSKANLKRYRVAVLKAAVEGKLTEAWRAEHPNTEPASKLLERILAERRQKWEADQLAKLAAAEKEPPKNWKGKYVEPILPDTTGLPELPEGWCWASVDALLREPLRNGHSARASGDGSGIRTLTLSAVTYGDFSEDNIKYTTADPQNVEDLWIEPGDILIERSNTPELVGTARLFNGPSRFAIFPDLLIRIRVSSSTDVAYCGLFLESDMARRYFRARAKGLAGSMPKIDQATILRCAVPLPPPSEQQQIVSEVAERLSQIEAAETVIDHSLRRAARLRQSILKQAFEGKLVPQDPNDEPASVLLERLRAKQAIHEGNGKADTPARTRGRRVKSKMTEGRADE